MGSPYRNSKATWDKRPRGHAGIQSVEVGFTLLDVLLQARGSLMLRDLSAAASMRAAKAHRRCFAAFTASDAFTPMLKDEIARVRQEGRTDLPRALADGHIALGIVALGTIGSLDAEWDGAVERPLRALARQLSSELGARDA